MRLDFCMKDAHPLPLFTSEWPFSDNQWLVVKRRRFLWRWPCVLTGWGTSRELKPISCFTVVIRWDGTLPERRVPNKRERGLFLRVTYPKISHFLRCLVCSALDQRWSLLQHTQISHLPKRNWEYFLYSSFFLYIELLSDILCLLCHGALQVWTSGFCCWHVTTKHALLSEVDRHFLPEALLEKQLYYRRPSFI